MAYHHRLIFLTLFAGIMALSSGCGPKMIKPHGTILNGGSPYEVEKGYRLTISFVPIVAKGQEAYADPYGASIAPGSPNFLVEGRGKKRPGIPPGEYRIAVELMQGASEADQWGGKFGRTSSPFVMDLQDDSDKLMIDLADHGGPPK